MRYQVSWSEIHNHFAEIEISDVELAEWAIENTTTRVLDKGQGRTPSTDELVRSLTQNPHLRDRLLQQFATHHPPTNTVTTTIPSVEAPQVLPGKRRKKIGKPAHEADPLPRQSKGNERDDY